MPRGAVAARHVLHALALERDRVDRPRRHQVVADGDRVAALLGRPAARPRAPGALAAEHAPQGEVVGGQVVLGEQVELERDARRRAEARVALLPRLVDVAAPALPGDVLVGEPLLGGGEMAVEQPAHHGLQGRERSRGRGGRDGDHGGPPCGARPRATLRSRKSKLRERTLRVRRKGVNVPRAPSPGRRPRLAASARRAQLVDVGRLVFAQRGYEAASVEEIAERAGITKPIVYEHFGGKEGLYAVIVDREVEHIVGRIVEAISHGLAARAPRAGGAGVPALRARSARRDSRCSCGDTPGSPGRRRDAGAHVRPRRPGRRHLHRAVPARGLRRARPPRSTPTRWSAWSPSSASGGRRAAGRRRPRRWRATSRRSRGWGCGTCRSRPALLATTRGQGRPSGGAWKGPARFPAESGGTSIAPTYRVVAGRTPRSASPAGSGAGSDAPPSIW